ncbi:hypothetical protein LPJ75_003226, partial [Coemansia sp. RSA 2598]
MDQQQPNNQTSELFREEAILEGEGFNRVSADSSEIATAEASADGRSASNAAPGSIPNHTSSALSGAVPSYEPDPTAGSGGISGLASESEA